MYIYISAKLDKREMYMPNLYLRAINKAQYINETIKSKFCN